MKRLKIAASFTLIFLMLAACGTESSEPTTVPVTTVPVTVPTVPETTENTPPETTLSKETTSPTSEPTLPETGALYFYAYYNDYGMSFHDYYLAPEGTEEWYQVYLDEESCYHPIPGVGFPDQGANIRRAYIFYDGPEVDRWVLRSELYATEEIESLFGQRDYDYLEYLWEHPVSITEGQTILCLGSEPSEPIPSWDIEFCENCPESWVESVPIETTPPETTEPAVEVTIPEGYNYSFFRFSTAPFHDYCDYYIAPAGTEDWCPVLIDNSYICYTHPRTVGGSLDDNACILRAYFAYDGPPATQWILRIEYPNEEVEYWPDIPQPYEYQWDTEFELENNHTILYLELSPDYLTLTEDAEVGEYYVPTTRPMEFCENCPESWLEPVG